MNAAAFPRTSPFVAERTDLVPEKAAEVCLGRDATFAVRVRLRARFRAARDGWVQAALARVRQDGNVTLLPETVVTSALSTQYAVLTSPWARVVFTSGDDGAAIGLVTAAGRGEGEVHGAMIEWEAIR